MTKQEIIDKLSIGIGLTKVDTEAAINGFMSIIIDALAKNDRVELRSFGTFAVKHRKPKKARNPGTGEVIYLQERHVPTFKPAQKMRQKVLDSLN